MPTIEISNSAFSFLQANAEPLVDTTSTSFDKIIAELISHRDKHATAQEVVEPEISGELKFSTRNVPSVTHTKFLSASVDGQPLAKKDWNHLLSAVMNACAENGATKEEILSHAGVNVINSTSYEYSYYPVDKLNLSFQGVDAKRACKFIVSLTTAFKVTVNAQIEWYAKEGAAYPGRVATLNF